MCPLSPEVQLAQFHQPGIFNYSALLLSEDEDTLYVGAREAVFAVSARNVSQKRHEVWPGLPAPVVWAVDPSSVSSNQHTAPPRASGPFLAMLAPWRGLTASCPWAAGPAIRKLPSCSVSTQPQLRRPPHPHREPPLFSWGF